MNPEMLDPKITRFLILSDGRSGTMMLTDFLDRLPQVQFFNLFAVNIKRPEKFWLMWEEFQQQRVGDISHVGTTMHRVGDAWLSRLEDQDSKVFWRTLQNKNEKVILLHRENKLRQLLSRKVGQAIKSYHVDSPRRVDPGKLTIPVLELQRYIEDLESLRSEIDHQFIEPLVLSFEELSDEWNTSSGRVEEFLGLPRSGEQPVTHRQETRCLRDAIENYDEVAEYVSSIGREEWL